MRVIAKRTLRLFWERHPDAGEPLRAWYDEASKANWQGPGDVKATYGNASIVANNRVVFNIGGNKYRLVVAMAYRWGRCWIKFVGTHAEYDRIDVETV